MVCLLEQTVEELGYRGAGRKLGFTGTYIHRIVNGLQPVTDTVAAALGYRPEPPLYRKLKP